MHFQVGGKFQRFTMTESAHVPLAWQLESKSLTLTRGTAAGRRFCCPDTDTFRALADRLEDGDMCVEIGSSWGKCTELLVG